MGIKNYLTRFVIIKYMEREAFADFREFERCYFPLSTKERLDADLSRELRLDDWQHNIMGPIGSHEGSIWVTKPLFSESKVVFDAIKRFYTEEGFKVVSGTNDASFIEVRKGGDNLFVFLQDLRKSWVVHIVDMAPNGECRI